MTILEIKDDWILVKEKLLQQWANLTDDDLRRVEGEYGEASGKRQKLQHRHEKREATATVSGGALAAVR